MLTTAGHRLVMATMVAVAVGAVLLAQVQDRTTQEPEPLGARDLSGVSVPVATLPIDPPGPSVTTPPAPPTVPATTTPEVPSERQAPGAVGVFTAAAGGTGVAGTGSLVTYSVEVEDAVGYVADEFARLVDETLADGRSWIADGSVAFQRVAAGAQVRVVLATPATVDGLCSPLQTNGIFSCHQGGTVAINSDRWLGGVDVWTGPLEEYRRYAVNHEMGHAIGHGHESCPGAGQVAPVMMQQSKGLDGCAPNGWPFP